MQDLHEGLTLSIIKLVKIKPVITHKYIINLAIYNQKPLSSILSSIYLTESS